MDDPRYTILWDAQFIANRLLANYGLSYLGAPFTIPNDIEQFELWYDPIIVNGAITAMQNRGLEIRSHDQIINLFAVIVRDAVVQSIRENPKAIGALAMEQVIDAATP